MITGQEQMVMTAYEMHLAYRRGKRNKALLAVAAVLVLWASCVGIWWIVARG